MVTEDSLENLQVNSSVKLGIFSCTFQLRKHSPWTLSVLIWFAVLCFKYIYDQLNKINI